MVIFYEAQYLNTGALKPFYGQRLANKKKKSIQQMKNINRFIDKKIHTVNSQELRRECYESISWQN